MSAPPVPNTQLTNEKGWGTQAFIAWMNGLGRAVDSVSASIAPLHLTDANTVEQYNSTTAQAGRIYNTRTDASNYERASIAWSGNLVTFATEAAGTGTVRDMRLQTTGNLGVGGTPTVKFHVFSAGVAMLATGAGETRIFAQNTSTSVIAQLGTGGGAGDPNVGSFSNHPFVFRTNDSDRGRFDATGNLIIGGTAAAASAIMQVDSTTKGFLPPRMTTAQRTAITPADGLFVFDATLQAYFYGSAGAWVQIATGDPVPFAQVVTTLAQTTFTVNFPSTGQTVICDYKARANSAGVGDNSFRIIFNGDATAANYEPASYMLANGSTAVSGTVASSTAGCIIGYSPGTAGNGNATGEGQILFSNFRDTTLTRKGAASVNSEFLGSTPSYFNSQIKVWWKSSAAITSVTFSDPLGFIAGCVFTFWKR